jgi:ABC-type amino acid transport substrate-binding protein
MDPGSKYGRKKKNVVIIGIGRTPECKKKYIWISKVHPAETAFVTINGKQHDIESGKLLKVVLVQSATPFHSLLIKRGYTNLSAVPVNALNAKKLAYDRGDAWFTPTSAAKWMWKREGRIGELTVGPVILKSEH